ncbi:hypothetical protein LSAT2_027695 [Lamellibrachia satsuma]|nr:hypothetical protein LSAT2_027695 [Lamellibrachia satsuma]
MVSVTAASSKQVRVRPKTADFCNRQMRRFPRQRHVDGARNWMNYEEENRLTGVQLSDGAIKSRFRLRRVLFTRMSTRAAPAHSKHTCRARRSRHLPGSEQPVAPPGV